MTETEDLFRSMIEIVISVVVLITILFGSAGTLAWPNAWIAVGMFALFCAVLWGWLRKHDPDLLRDRTVSETDSGRPAYDKVFSLIYKLTFLIWLSLMGVDAIRFGWSDAPIWVNVSGGFVLVVAFTILFFVFAENSYLAREVRIQTERDHTVVSSGPYGIVRHPMYAAIGLMFLGAALLMGSYVGVLIAMVMTIMLCIRCVLEEGTLTESLGGYKEYRHKVRYRIIPWIW